MKWLLYLNVYLILILWLMPSFQRSHSFQILVSYVRYKLFYVVALIIYNNNQRVVRSVAHIHFRSANPYGGDNVLSDEFGLINADFLLLFFFLLDVKDPSSPFFFRNRSALTTFFSTLPVLISRSTWSSPSLSSSSLVTMIISSTSMSTSTPPT